MKRQEHTVNSNRHVLPHVLSTVYRDCGESTNAAATLPSRSWPLVVENMAINSMNIIIFTDILLDKKIQK